MLTPLQTIQQLVAPVIMISANGLICLALYNRLAAIVSRARTFHKERYDALTHLSAMNLEEQTGVRAHQMRQRVDALENQVFRILRRAKLIRNALLFLLASVLAMLACSLTLGVAVEMDNVRITPLIFFVIGTLAMMTGVTLAMFELAWALEPVTAEGFAMEGQARSEV